MEKPTDETASSPASSSGSSGGSATEAADSSSNATTTVYSEANQQSQQIVQKHHQLHNHQNNTTTTTYETPTKNQLNNSLGCGPSTTALTAAKTSYLLDRGGCSNNIAGGGSSNLNSNNIISSLNNTTLGHQSSNNNNNNATFSAASLSNTSLSSSGSAASASNNNTTTTSSLLSSSSSLSPQMAPINLNISTTTGGNFSVSVDPQITVENLKKIIAKKLKVAKDRICLLHREKELQDGLLKENNLMDGSKIILIPNVETGLLAQRPENTVMQALESLNDSQVNDFLSGKTPLNLSMRLGDHMMLIQLQLSTVNPNGVNHNGASCKSSSSRQRSSHHHHHHHRSSQTAAPTASAATQTSAAGTATTANHSHHHHHHHHHHHNNNNNSNAVVAAGSAITSATLTPTAMSVATTAQNDTGVRKLELDTTTCQAPHNVVNTSTLVGTHATRTAPDSGNSTSSPSLMSTKNSDLNSFLSKRDYESLQNIVKSIAMAQPSRLVQQSITTSKTTNVGIQTTGLTLPTASSTSVVPVVAAPSFHTASEAVLLEQSPIKSLSNLVSSPIKTTAIQNIPTISNNTNNNSSSSNNNSVALGPHTVSISAASSATSSNATVFAANTAICQDPIAAKLTSCLCTRLNGGSLGTVNNTPPHASAKQCIETACISQQQLQQQQHHSHHQQQTQPHATRTSTSAIMTSTPNYKATLTPGSIITALNGANTSSASTSRSSSSLHKTAHNPISRKHRHHHHHHHHHHHYHHPAGVQQQLNTANKQNTIANASSPIKVLANDSGFNSGDDSLINVTTANKSKSSTSASLVGNISHSPVVSKIKTTPVVAAAAATKIATSSSTLTTTSSNVNTVSTATTNPATTIELDDSGIVSDSRTLAEASRNLTQTLRKLSKEVFTNKIDFSSASDETPRKSGSGAVIESMKNHGKGIYSGTFSGTLNPALQDRYGRPKRDISTVIHILNDLLSATPQYHRGARISFEAPSTSAAAAASVAAASGSTGVVHHSSKSKHISSKYHPSSHHCVKCIKTHNSSSSTINLQSASTSNASGTTNSNTSTASSSPVCAYGECNGHYVSSKSQSSKIYPCCQQDCTTATTSASSAVTVNSSALAQQNQVGHNSSSSNTTSGTPNGHHHHHHHHHHGSSHHHHHHHHQAVDERKMCQCRYRVHSETGERERDYTCQKCAAELDNIKTKSKLDQLRLVMQQRKQKREARKLKGAPYGARVVGTTTTAATGGSVADNTASTLTTANGTISTPISVATSASTPSEVSPNHLVEEVDTAA